MSISVYTDSHKLSEAAVRLFLSIAAEAVKDQGRFTVALSGGGSPRETYELLASEPFKSRVPWKDTFVFWGDERFVPADDPENNARMARQTLLDHVPIPFDHIFPIPTKGTPEQAVQDYASTLAAVFDGDLPRFDLILLGLGQNGHTASLFPEKKVLKENKKWTGAIYLEEKDQSRITLTAPVINNARNIVFIAFGASKAQTIAAVLEGPSQPQQLPAQLISPKNGSLYWLVDDAASRLLKTEG